MADFTRGEIEETLAEFTRRADAAADSGDWSEWSEMFTEDAHYLEHHLGEFHRRAAILEWITATMAEWPASEMVAFPTDWHLVDVEAGRVVAKIRNRFADPGDGSSHQHSNLTILEYAGDGRWKSEEDVYNPASFGQEVAAWIRRKKELAAGS